MFSRKRYLALFRESASVDPLTGREKRELVYVGPTYKFSAPEAEVARLKKRLLAVWLHQVCASVVCGFLNSGGSRCFYVLPFYLFLAFPLFYAGLGAIRLMRQKPRFTEPDKAEGVYRVRSSCVGIAALSLLHTLGEIAYMILNRETLVWSAELAATLLVAFVGVCALRSYSLSKRLAPVREE